MLSLFSARPLEKQRADESISGAMRFVCCEHGVNSGGVWTFSGTIVLVDAFRASPVSFAFGA